jgi:hypothetical protein
MRFFSTAHNGFDWFTVEKSPFRERTKHFIRFIKSKPWIRGVSRVEGRQRAGKPSLMQRAFAVKHPIRSPHNQPLPLNGIHPRTFQLIARGGI